MSSLFLLAAMVSSSSVWAQQWWESLHTYSVNKPSTKCTVSVGSESGDVLRLDWDLPKYKDRMNHARFTAWRDEYQIRGDITGDPGSTAAPEVEFQVHFRNKLVYSVKGAALYVNSSVDLAETTWYDYRRNPVRIACYFETAVHAIHKKFEKYRLRVRAITETSVLTYWLQPVPLAHPFEDGNVIFDITDPDGKVRRSDPLINYMDSQGVLLGLDRDGSELYLQVHEWKRQGAFIGEISVFGPHFKLKNTWDAVLEYIPPN